MIHVQNVSRDLDALSLLEIKSYRGNLCIDIFIFSILLSHTYFLYMKKKNKSYVLKNVYSFFQESETVVNFKESLAVDPKFWLSNKCLKNTEDQFC